VFNLSLGLLAPIGRFVLRRPDHFPNGVVATIDDIRPFLFALAIFKKPPTCRQAQTFHPRGWPARAMETFLGLPENQRPHFETSLGTEIVMRSRGRWA